MAKEKFKLKNSVTKKVNNFIQILKDDNLPIQSVYLYGSQVSGRARQGSDIDLCVVSPKFKNRSQAMDYLWQKRRQIDYLLEPIGYNPKDFIDEDPMVWEIKNNGIKLA